MRKQRYEEKREQLVTRFQALKQDQPEILEQELRLSWSNWGFGMERLDISAKRLQNAGISYIELHGNHYGPDLGYRPAEVRQILDACGLRVSGVCGMFSPKCDLSSNQPSHRQAAIDYLKREITFTAEMGGEYLLVVPAAVGRSKAYDDSEFQRSVETLQLVSELFCQAGIKGAVEPIRSAETSLIHTVAEAKQYIAAVDSPGVRHINGDVYHMQSEETFIGEAILEAGEQLVNLHLADSNRGALGTGSLDLDCVIMALSLIGYQRPGHFVTPEPLGPGGDPYPAMNGNPDPAQLDLLVQSTVSYFRERTAALKDV